jgi:hypothetical protein
MVKKNNTGSFDLFRLNRLKSTWLQIAVFFEDFGGTWLLCGCAFSYYPFLCLIASEKQNQ